MVINDLTDTIVHARVIKHVVKFGCRNQVPVHRNLGIVIRGGNDVVNAYPGVQGGRLLVSWPVSSVIKFHVPVKDEEDVDETANAYCVESKLPGFLIVFNASLHDAITVIQSTRMGVWVGRV